MTNKKTTKRALLTSIMAMFLCLTMFVGTTYAWFTDSVTSSGNKIVAGTLDVDLEVLDEKGRWNSVAESNDPIFNYTNWEPGYTEVKILKVVNEGTLDLKWQAKLLAPNGVSELADVIDVYVKEDVTAYPTSLADVTANWTKVGTLARFIEGFEEVTKGEIKANETKDAYEALGIAFHMQETAGNKYQGMELGEFDIMIVAGQLNSESDSFGSDYDADASYTAEIDALRAKLAVANPGDTVEYSLSHDAYLTSRITVPEGVDLVLDGNGYNMIMNTSDTGIYAYRADVTLKNLKITGSAQCAVFTKGDRGIVNGQMVEYLVYPVFENVTVDMDKSSLAPLYFNGMGEATLTNCTITGAGYVRTNYVNGAHIFAGAEMKVTVNGDDSNIGVIFINANGESTTSIFGSSMTMNGGTVEKLVLESDWREDQANNAAYTYNGGTVKEVVKVVDTGAELEAVLKEAGYSVALSRDITLEGHLTASAMGDINIDGSGKTLSIRGIHGNNGANVTLSNMTLVDNNPDDYMIYNQGGKIELTNVTYSGNTNKAFQLAGGGDVVLNNCNITGEVTGTYSASNIWCGDGRNVTINGGTYGSIFMNVSEGANILSASKITVNDGTIGKLILETEKNTKTGDGNGYKSAILVQNGGTITELVENPQNYDLTGLTKLN